MIAGTDLSVLYSLRKNFTVVALTGRTGSGMKTVSQQMKKGFNKNDYPAPDDPRFDIKNNSYRKYKIIYETAQETFVNYELILYRNVVALFFLKHNFQELKDFLNSPILSREIKKFNLPQNLDFDDYIKNIDRLKEQFELQKSNFSKFDVHENKDKKTYKGMFEFFYSKSYENFCDEFYQPLIRASFARFTIIFQMICHNIRRSGSPYRQKETDASNIFSIANYINSIIKAIRSAKEGNPAKVVIDSLRNPYEVMFFKQRFSAFYLIAVNMEDEARESKLKNRYKNEYEKLSNLFELEYAGGKGKEFYKQYVRSCIEKADIHLTFRTEDETKRLNEEAKKNGDNSSPFYSWSMQLLKYISLIERPGIVTPSPEERCMQLAYTAKYNSGCISRQVGAAITDENFSIKAIGWNNTPEGQVPCLLRNARLLIEASMEDLEKDEIKQSPELQAFTPYEKTNPKFRKELKENFENQMQTNSSLIQGRNICMCFKSLHNSCVEGKNQVHTRSLHAEESAFLQITKYGGVAIKNGKLFTTASPCELCAKKAYQLGIKVIYYVDPYPGISKQQILNTGYHKPDVRLFNGAIGKAYHWLYEPFMAYKDELALILGQDIKDLTAQQKDTIEAQANEISRLREQINELKDKDDTK